MSQRIPDSFIQEVLARNDIVEIIRSRVTLIQRGDNHVARCPFHEEKTPSFNVSHSKQFYYCFGCSASGNAIGFLIAFDHLEFREAVASLAARAGLEMPSHHSNEDSQSYKILYQVLESAGLYYQSALRLNSAAVEYLKSRGVSGIIAKHFGIGYAPADWESLQQQIGHQIDQEAALAASGLVIIKNQERPYNRFRDRIMFPIRNIQGKLIGFGGRSLGDAQPKYLNSPETLLFHKGHELYGLHEARQYATKLSKLIVVEGYMDVIALHQHGITHAVATLGTAVTAQQVQKCLRYVADITFCFDGDRAGRLAAWKALTITLPLLREGIHIRFLFLPETEDPDSLVRKIGKEAFLQQLSQALPLPEVFFKELKNQIPLHSPADKAHFGQQAARYLNTMSHGLYRQLMYEELAKQLEIEAEALNNLLQPPPLQSTYVAQPAIHNKSAAASVRSTTGMPRLLEEQVLALLLQYPMLATEYNPGQYDTIISLAQERKSTKLLLSIWKALFEQPTLTIGELLAQIEDESDRQLIAKLATRPKLLPLEEVKSEFLGGLSGMRQQNVELEIQALIQKTKKSELNLAEKRKLQTLLATLKKDASER